MRPISKYVSAGHNFEQVAAFLAKLWTWLQMRFVQRIRSYPKLEKHFTRLKWEVFGWGGDRSIWWRLGLMGSESICTTQEVSAVGRGQGGSQVKKYRGMGFLEAMTKGSNAWYLGDTLKLTIAQGVVGAVADKRSVLKLFLTRCKLLIKDCKILMHPFAVCS